MINTPIKRSIAFEAGWIWVASIVLTGLFGLLGLVVPFVAQNLLAFVAATFLYLPAWVLWRRHVDLADYGLRAAPLAHGLLLFAVVAVVVLPPFYLGHHFWQAIVLDRGPDLDRVHWVRFDRDLDDRPDLPLATGQLHVWLEGDRLVVVNGGDNDVGVVLHVEPTRADADPVHDMRSVRQDGDRLLRAGRAHAKVGHDGTVEATLPPGQGLSIAAPPVETLRLEATAETVLKGRYRIPADTPYETERSPWWWLFMFGSQLVLVALPEEWFYRGYLQRRLHEAWGTRWRIMGADLGWGWVISSALFAVGHLILDPRPTRLAVFFPSLLFGWMRARTGSVLAPTLFHAVSNVWIQALAYVYVTTL